MIRTIKTIEDRISNVGAEIGVTLEEVAGQNDQIVALVGEGDMVSNLRVYNLPNFDLVYDFPAMHNDDLLSLNFNRIPAENSYHYVIGLSQFETDADKKYGVVKHYDSSGKEVNKVRLPVTNESERFSVFLTETTLDPKIVNDDDKIEYVYAYQDRINDVQANTYAIAQDENNVIATFSGRTDKGNVNSAGYLTNRKGEFDRLYIYYGGDYSATSFLTEFYKIPMQTLKVNDISNAKQSIKYLSNVNQIRIDYDYQTYQVYSVNGNLISSGNSVQTIFTNGWNKGVYIIKTIDKQGKANTAKILVF